MNFDPGNRSHDCSGVALRNSRKKETRKSAGKETAGRMRRSARVVPRRVAKAKPESPESSPTANSDSDFEDTPEQSPPPSKKRPRVLSIATKDASPAPEANSTKRRRVKTTSNHSLLHKRLFDVTPAQPASTQDVCSLPDRQHAVTYHRPLLLDSRKGRKSLLSWFDGVSTARSMPWRKAWIDPFSEHLDEVTLREKLERRAYEVWISEIMLQQTRVAVVIDYWNKWMAKWPTIHDLAAADADDVLAAWRGLGYYSRATRIHEAAKLVTKDKDLLGLLPSSAEELQAKVPGIGRYTGGAISAIVFGQPAPMVDGNVLRVLSRQLGLLGDVKSDKAVIDLLWAAADALVKIVAKDAPANMSGGEDWQVLPSDRPGRWGQALMELGSTVCQPKPSCEKCPITASCRAYTEGFSLATKTSRDVEQKIVDIEDACSMCATPDPISTQDGENSLASNKKGKGKSTGTVAPEHKPGQKKQSSLQAFAFTKTKTKDQSPANPPDEETKKPSAAISEAVANYAKQFPLKTEKKAVREEETLVCAVRRRDGQYLIQRRPDKGLLAGMWEFPSCIIDPAEIRTPKSRKDKAQNFVEDLAETAFPKSAPQVRHVGELGTIPWLFSHIKLEMHVHLFELGDGAPVPDENPDADPARMRWTARVDEESMGTGMRKCVALVQDVVDPS
ncbi:DNA glycosylase [Microdochium trichocladiopsis]|uniref:Adenine DNA glycosylase n=1 Tax=Microdochium trichocladiopsis TaxID=1682393 RepID=A0A9P8YJA8_9PEZI|nr:DNA glycosylase [Microdochium trichocladiopsis]KAH7040075.1 DNA glycosylase [Microdochium trichocladiopsis]